MTMLPYSANAERLDCGIRRGQRNSLLVKVGFFLPQHAVASDYAAGIDGESPPNSS